MTNISQTLDPYYFQFLRCSYKTSLVNHIVVSKLLKILQNREYIRRILKILENQGS